MDEATGEAEEMGLRVAFDRRLKLQFHGATVTGRHTLLAQFRQAVFGRLAGYEDVTDADRLGRDPAMRWVVGGHAVSEQAVSTSQMGRFETGAMTEEHNLTALAHLSGRWIDRVQGRRGRRVLVLDIDSSVSPAYGAQEGTAYNTATSPAPVTIRSSCSTKTATWNGARSGPATPTAPTAGATCWTRWSRGIAARPSAACCAAMRRSPFRTCTNTWRRRASSTPSVSRRIRSCRTRSLTY
jgi:hypothetical protein